MSNELRYIINIDHRQLDVESINTQVNKKSFAKLWCDMLVKKALVVA